MSTTATMKELLGMKPAELQREIAIQKVLVASLRMAVKLQKEKDSAKYKREKKALARMQTALSAIDTEQLKESKEPSTVPAPKKKSRSTKAK